MLTNYSVAISRPVRKCIRDFFKISEKRVVQLPHISLHSPEMQDMLNKPCLRALVQQVLERALLSNSKVLNENSWLNAVPLSLRNSEEDIVNYLGMVVAVDFRHWGEKGLKNSAHDGFVKEEEVVEVVPFYCVAAQDSTNRGDQTLGERRETSSALPTAQGRVLMMRGSAAMIYLLRRAVDDYHIPWYSPSFLNTFHSEQEALEGLKPCFLGCTSDLVTPMWIPAVKERVAILLSLAKVLTTEKLSFYEILRSCNAMLFDSSRNGFIDQLVRLHPRYCDFGELQVTKQKRDSTCKKEETIAETQCFPILKLSQLTAIAIIDALHAFWSDSNIELSTTSTSWIDDARCRRAESQQKKGLTRFLFHDEDQLSICCDYQIPKALRACDVMRFDVYLADKISKSILLPTNSLDEVAIRVGTLIAGEMLLHSIQKHFCALCHTLGIPLDSNEATVSVTAQHLDYALWFGGRSISWMNHHLCRTLMY